MLSLLIKPASSNCNLNCKYCFYYDVSENREIKSYGFMKLDTLEQIVKKAFEYAKTQCLFAFQGGEPTLIGLEFYEKLIELQKKYNVKNIGVQNTIQTNGTLLTEKWVEFLSQNNFLVGVSLDGSKDIHDSNRVDDQNKGTFTKVMKSIHLLNKYKVEYNVLFVVTGKTARHPEKIYNFFKKNELRYIQFIPCLNPIGEKPGMREYSLKPESYGTFLKNIFDLWYKDVINNDMVSIRYFDNLLRRVMGYNTEACGMNGVCGCQFVIEANGNVYPCDFYVIDQWHMGNIEENDIGEMQNSPVVRDFIESSKYVSEECKDCTWFKLCRGGCRRERENFQEEKLGLNIYCSAYKEFFNYSYKRFFQIANSIR